MAALTRDVRLLAASSRRGVDAACSNAALKKLFSDPHFNVMDGLDTYIDDYSKPDPIPPSMLRQMAQSAFLGLFDDEDEPAKTGARRAGAGSPDGAGPPRWHSRRACHRARRPRPRR